MRWPWRLNRKQQAAVVPLGVLERRCGYHRLTRSLRKPVDCCPSASRSANIAFENFIESSAARRNWVDQAIMADVYDPANDPHNDPAYLRHAGRPIWHWLHTHFSLPTILDATTLKSLTSDQCLDDFVVSLKTMYPGGCFCVAPHCPGCLRSGQDVLLFVHLLSTHLRNFPPVLVVEPELTAKLISLSKECRVKANHEHFNV